MEFKIDLHIHTIYSDGTMEPVDVVTKFKDEGYDIIAITDHDNTNGIAEGMIAAEAGGIKLIPGIEIAVVTEEGTGLHMLGYHIDIENEALKNFLDAMVQRRTERNEQLFRVLQAMGYDISREDITAGKNDYIGKPLIARALVSKGYIAEEKQAFGRDILGSAKCRAVKKVKPLAKDAIQIIKEAGGTPVLAHPIQTRGIGRPGSEQFYENIDTIIGRLKRQGLKGLECFHPDQNFEQSMRFVEMAEKYHLHITRGSDFHGIDFADAEETAYR